MVIYLYFEMFFVLIAYFKSKIVKRITNYQYPIFNTLNSFSYLLCQIIDFSLIPLRIHKPGQIP